jgi:hypothetical protein
MGNQETLATLSTQDAKRRQTKQKTQHRKLKRGAGTAYPNGVHPHFSVGFVLLNLLLPCVVFQQYLFI